MTNARTMHASGKWKSDTILRWSLTVNRLPVDSYTLCLLGVEALELHRTGSPRDVEAHFLFKGYLGRTPGEHADALERLGRVDELVTSMVDPNKSERAVSDCLPRSIKAYFCVL